jgi:hypothetical protein
MERLAPTLGGRGALILALLWGNHFQEVGRGFVERSGLGRQLVPNPTDAFFIKLGRLRPGSAG